jgi:hypothetical protein
MVAYSFQKRFAPKILGGTKQQTIRLVGRRRHARPGEEIQCYTGLRTKHARLIRRVTCTDVLPIHIWFVGRSRIKVGDDLVYDLDSFAIGDGFDHWDDMWEFWREHHDKPSEFSGLIIKWSADNVLQAEE